MSKEVFNCIQTDRSTWRFETDMVRAWLFAGTEKAALIDTTNFHGDLAGAVRTVTDLPVILINSHAHRDHISSNGCFETAYMHPDEFEFYAKNAEEGFAAPGSLYDGQIIDLGGQELEVIHIPGHTHGSIALLNRTKRILVSGDTISAGPVFLFDEEHDYEKYKASLLRLKSCSADYDCIYTSHGAYKVENAQIDNQLACLDECLAGKVPAEEPPFPMPAKMYRSHGAGYYLVL